MNKNNNNNNNNNINSNNSSNNDNSSNNVITTTIMMWCWCMAPFTLHHLHISVPLGNLHVGGEQHLQIAHIPGTLLGRQPVQ